MSMALRGPPQTGPEITAALGKFGVSTGALSKPRWSFLAADPAGGQVALVTSFLDFRQHMVLFRVEAGKGFVPDPVGIASLPLVHALGENTKVSASAMFLGPGSRTVMVLNLERNDRHRMSSLWSIDFSWTNPEPVAVSTQMGSRAQGALVAGFTDLAVVHRGWEMELVARRSPASPWHAAFAHFDCTPRGFNSLEAAGGRRRRMLMCVADDAGPGAVFWMVDMDAMAADALGLTTGPRRLANPGSYTLFRFGIRHPVELPLCHQQAVKGLQRIA